jgi:serine/threonine-protein kinase
MSTEEPAPGTTGDSGDALDAEAGRVFDAYLADREAGRAADPDDLLAAHPHLADRLRACLEVMCWAGHADGPAGSPEATGGHGPGPSGGWSVLSAVWPNGGEPPRVLLREPPGLHAPLLRPVGPAAAGEGRPAEAGRYRLLGEIARGGMGAVLRGHDADLGRDLAIKVLLEKHRRDPEVLRRFVEEAQIGGQLQHPGIVPVYELGVFPDRRPFFAMKLVQGQTLAALLAGRTGPAQDRARYLGVFEQVCQTVAYAHARGVIHRDLKPSNVMVGSFGEVQVMDWGLAKVLAQGGAADEWRARSAEGDRVNTLRAGSSAHDSRAGSVLGTPAYMPPEQARGEVERLDERADVFGLGAILCEVLTGRPPYVGDSTAEIRRRAEQAELGDALARLDACGADPDLLALARRCLSADPDHRPRNAGDVAGR